MADLCSAAVMSMSRWKPGEPDLLYHPPTGMLRVGHAHDWPGARNVMADEFPLVQLALIDRLQSEIRYGAPRGFSLLQRDQLNVQRHSVFVADRCEQLAELLGLPLAVRAGCKFLGARHDLHEALPGIKDMHGPALRWYRSCSPELDSAHRMAERLVRTIVGTPQVMEQDQVLLSIVGPHIVKYADRDAMAVEHAFIFRDRPDWLEQRVELIDMCNDQGYGWSTPYEAIDFGDMLTSWLDQCLRDPTSTTFSGWERAPVPMAELSALRTWYDTIAAPRCRELST